MYIYMQLKEITKFYDRKMAGVLSGDWNLGKTKKTELI